MSVAAVPMDRWCLTQRGHLLHRRVPAWLSQRQAHPRAERAARTCDSIHGMQKASTVLSAAAGRSCRLFNFGKRK